MKKLYVIVREDMKASCRAFHGGHALAQFILENDVRKMGWDNGTLVYLTVENEDELKKYIDKMEKSSIIHSVFAEPDLEDQITAIASIEGKKLFKHLPLL